MNGLFALAIARATIRTTTPAAVRSATIESVSRFRSGGHAGCGPAGHVAVTGELLVSSELLPGDDRLGHPAGVGQVGIEGGKRIVRGAAVSEVNWNIRILRSSLRVRPDGIAGIVGIRSEPSTSRYRDAPVGRRIGIRVVRQAPAEGSACENVPRDVQRTVPMGKERAARSSSDRISGRCFIFPLELPERDSPSSEFPKLLRGP